MVPNCTSLKCPVEDAILEYARENLVMFNIFIKDPYAKRFQKDEKITKTSYIANSGGLLGLCMGFSLISGAEILFHCFFGVYSALFPTEKKKQRLKKEGSTLGTKNSNTLGSNPHHHHCCHESNGSHYNGSNERQYSSSTTHLNSNDSKCCNFQHIVQLQDGTTRSVLCSNLKMAPLRLRSQLTSCPIGNGSCGNPNTTITTTANQNTCNNSSSAINTTVSTSGGSVTDNKMYTGPERIIWKCNFCNGYNQIQKQTHK